MTNVDDDDIKLPEDTLAILNQFLKEKEAQDEEIPEENWNLSQFWYSDETQKVFGKLVKNLLKKRDDESFSIALLSCPSLFGTIRSINDNTKIFEFDKRFESYGADFKFYDYNKATEEGYLSEFEASFDLIIADPPFLSEECLEKTATIIKKLTKDKGLIILNTGSIQRELAYKYLSLNESSYKPQHKNNLGNEFSSFSNFELDQLL